MKNNRQSFVKLLKDKFPKFSFVGIIGRLSIGLTFLMYAKNTYKKMQFKHSVADIEKNDIYESNDQIEKKKNQSNLKINRLIFYSKYLNFLISPIFFVQVKKSQFEDRDLHLHYYKLYSHLRSEGKTFKLSYLFLDKLSDKEKEKLKEYLKLNKIEDINKLAYFVTNSQGQPIPIFVKEENLESTKRFLSGIPIFYTLDQLSTCLKRQSDEAIQIITTGHNNIPHKIVKSFFTNSSLFSKNTFNILINSTGFPWINLNNKLQDKNEILIMLNPKYYNLDNILEREMISNNSYLYIYDVIEQSLTPIKEFIQNNKDNYFNLYSNRYLLSFKYNVKSDSSYEEDEMKRFVNYLEYLIDPNNGLQNLNNQNLSSPTFPERFYLTNNLDLASYYKSRLFSKKEKFVFVYIDLKNLTKSNLNVDETTKFFLNSFSSYKKHDQQNNSGTSCNYIITHNPSIAKCFNIIPKSNENVAIRFIDYSSVTLFDEKGGYKLFKNDQLSELQNNDRNKMFYYKSKYSEKTLNETTFIKTLEKFFKQDKEYKNENPHYLESSSNYLDDDSVIKNLNAEYFKEKVLLKPGKKIVFTVSDNCVGCVKTKQILEKLYEDKLNKENIQIFEYDTMNESIHFNKIQNNPKLFLYENSKLLAKIDVMKILEISENNFDTIEKEIINVFKL